jgi:hypothetical protein
LDKDTSTICFQCGSPLILVSEVTEQVSGSRFSQTTTIYRCSNKECQEEKDKQKEKRIKLQSDKVIADQKRADEKLSKKAAPVTKK